MAGFEAVLEQGGRTGGDPHTPWAVSTLVVAQEAMPAQFVDEIGRQIVVHPCVESGVCVVVVAKTNA